jgi:2-octaprenyl-6-methoxyphenol hydroxylase
MKNKIIHYDVVIMGAGLVGASLAAALLPANLKIAIIDKAPAPEYSKITQYSFNSRAIALSWSSIQLLKKLNVWTILEKKSVIEYIHEVEVSEQGHFPLTRIDRNQFKLPYLGAVLDADTLNYCLNYYLEENTKKNVEGSSYEAYNKNQSQIDFFRKTEVKKIERKDLSSNPQQDNVWQLELLDDTVIQSTLLVGADGSHSFVRKTQGVGLRTEPQTQTALVMNVALMQNHKGVAYERFLKNGAIAMLPFGEERVKCVWIASNEEAQALKAMENAGFVKVLQKQFGFRLGIFKDLGERFSYPIQVSSAENIYGHGWVLIGNAANTLSPVAAQGFNLGLRDACILAETLMQSNQKTRELQRIDLFKKYADRRRQDQTRVKEFTQQLEIGGLRRRLGILACEWFSPLKHQIGQLGMGLKSESEKEGTSI